MIHDLRHALRSLAKAPGFAASALATLGLGIGAATVVFSIVNGLLLRPFPFGEATGRIVSLHATHPTQFPEEWDDAGVSYADLQDIRRESRLLEDVAAHLGRSFTLYGDEAVRVLGGSVTPNLFSLLNVEPALGRDFRPGEGALPGFETVVLLSHGLWQSRFGGDTEIIGRPILINERELTVIGIMPPRFRFPEVDELWVPYDPGSETNRSARGLLAVGRLREGVALAQARQELEAIAERLARRHPETNRGWGIHLLAYRDLVVKPTTRLVASALLVAVGLVLWIGCANLASLLLARGTARQRELAVRSALGAGRGRLVRQMLVESLLLGLAGGALGTLLAVWGLDAIVVSLPEELPYWLYFDLDWRVASFIMGTSVLTSVVFGLVPALRVSRIDLVAVLGGGRDAGSGRGALRLQGALVVGQIALSLALLVGASLMFQSFLELYTADPGFEEDDILTLRLYLAGDAYDPLPAKIGFFREAVERIRSVPGVRSAAVTTSVPADDGGVPIRLVTAERPVADGSETGVRMIGVTPGFFETLGVSLLEGRAFNRGDLAEDALPVAIVNQRLAQRLWPRQRLDGRQIGVLTGTEVAWHHVVGVAPNIQFEEFGEETIQSRLNVYVPYSRTPYRSMAVLVRADRNPAGVAASVREELRRFAPGVPAFFFRTMRELRYLSTWDQRFFSHMFNTFAVSAVLLACLGIYGLVAYRVGRRTREIGIRLALGAAERDVLRLLLRQSLALACAGVALGLVLSFGVSRLLEALLYRVAATNPVVYASAAAWLFLSVLLASYLPVRRATRIQPMASLRRE